MPGIARSLGKRLKSSVGGLFEPAADPREQFADVFQRQRDLLGNVRRALGAIAATKRQLEVRTADVGGKLLQLQGLARAELLAGREDRARLALHRRQLALIEVQALERQLREVELEEQRLALVEQRLAAQVDAFFARQQMIAARYSAAEAQVRIQEALGGVSQDLADLGLALERAEAKTGQMQARASAIDRLVEDGVLAMPGLAPGDMLERELASLDLTRAVDEQLDLLRREIAEPDRGRLQAGD